MGRSEETTKTRIFKKRLPNRNSAKNKLITENNKSDRKIGNLIVFTRKRGDRGAIESKKNEISSMTYDSGKKDDEVKKDFSDSESQSRGETNATDTSSLNPSKNDQLSEEDILDMIEDGHKITASGMYDKSKRLLRNALKRTSDRNLKAKLWLAQADISTKQREDEAIPEIERFEVIREIADYYIIALKYVHDHSEVLIIHAKLGNILFDFGDLDGAQEHYSTAVTDVSSFDRDTSAQMLYNYSMIKYQKKQFDEAELYFAKFLACEKSVDHLQIYIVDFELAYYIGRSLFQTDHQEFAAKLFLTFLREYQHKNPEPGFYNIGKVHLMLAEIYEKSNDIKKLDLADYHYSSYLDIKNPEIKARIQNVNCVESSVQPNADNETISVLVRFAHLRLRTKKFSLSGSCLREAYYAMKSFSIRNDLVLFRLLEGAYNAYKKANNHEHLIFLLQELISLSIDMKGSNHPVPDEQIADHYEALGNLYKKGDKIYLACNSFNKCLELKEKILSPSDPSLNKLKCKVSTYLYNEKKYKEALVVCLQVADRATDNAMKRRALCIVGKIRAKQWKRNECITAFEDALNLARLSGENSMDVSNTFELFGQANFDLERFDECVDCFHNAYKIRTMNEESSSNECINLIYGMIEGYKMMKKYKLALLACSKILRTQRDKQIGDIETASTIEMMAELYCMIDGKDSYAKALEQYYLLSEIFHAQKGPSDETLLLIYVKMAKIHGLKLCQYNQALELFHIVNKSYVLDEQDDLIPTVALIGLEGEGDVLFRKGEYSSALSKYTNMIKFFNRMGSKIKMAEQELQKLMCDMKMDLFLKIGRIHKTRKEYDVALDNFMRALNICNRSRIIQEEANELRTSELLYEIGLIYVKKDNRATAIEKFVEAGEILENIPVLDSKGLTLSDNIDDQLLKTRGIGCMSLF